MLDLTVAEKKYALYVARMSIKNKFQEDREGTFEHPQFETDSDALVAKTPVYVSLYAHGALRGSSGHHIAYHPVITEIYDQARFAAFNDAKFPPLTEIESDTVEIHLSLLSRLVPTNPYDIRIGIHGILVKKGIETGALLLPHRGVMGGFTVESFWSTCCEIAELPADMWRTGRLSLLRFTAIEFGELDPEIMAFQWE